VSERGTVTLLFADLVGSTELFEQLGDEEADVVRRDLFRVLRSSLSAQSGTEVKNLGDGLMATFASAVDAVSCAVQIQRTLSDPTRPALPWRLQVRIGAHAGEPIRDEGDYFGSTVVAARRLCENAAPGQILVSDLVRGLVGSRGRFEFGDVTPLRLKGFSRPLPACEVRWGMAALDTRLPEALEHASLEPLAGREDVMRQLREAWSAASSGAVQFVFLSGPPGIGKTRTAAQLAREVNASGGLVLYGRCEEVVQAPYQPFVNALDTLSVNNTDDGMSDRLGSAASEVARLALDASRLPAALQLQAEEARYRLFKQVARMLRDAAGSRPTVLVLDDLHWADRSSLLLLGFLAGELRTAPLLVLGTYRDVELDHAHPLTLALASLRRLTAVEDVPLQGLSLPAVIDMVAAIARQELPRRGRLLAEALHEETEGNPFFIAEIIKHLIETGRLYQEGGRWTSDAASITELDIPASVREVLDRRLFRLSAPCRRALAVAALVGAEFNLGLLRKVSGLAEAELLAALEEAIDAGVIAEAPAVVAHYTFAHALIRQTLLGELSTTRRLWLHQQVGEALEELSAGRPGHRLPQLAYHFTESGPAGREKAMDYALRAGAQAAELLAYEEAARHYRNALEVMDHVDAVAGQRCETLLALGDALWRAGDRREAKRVSGEAAGLARQMGDGERFARAALGYGVGLGGFGYVDRADAELVKLLEEALITLGESESALHARVMARLAVELYYTHERERREALSEEALRIARRVGDPSVLLVAMYSREKAIEGPDSVEERLVTASEMLELATNAGDRGMEFLSHHFRLATLLELGDIRGVDVELDACAHLAGELSQPVMLWQTCVFQAMRAMLAGRFEEGWHYAQEALELGQGSQGAIAAVHFGTQSFQYYWGTGSLAELEEPTRAFAQRYPSSAWRAGLTFLYADTGREDKARANSSVLRPEGSASSAARVTGSRSSRSCRWRAYTCERARAPQTSTRSWSHTRTGALSSVPARTASDRSACTWATWRP
jgi:class 3 adenylate cyclase/DNA polymerase III delta prime subunit